ncbi:MAG: iron-sulfur cluster carrier protein ApbC [Halorhodospira halophila]|uniref:iron-sulfur cluster carrier protein ApbC n=1 Tax=Halorhodospira TaxID=85108 RepID=UPI0019112E0A|nr:MULTISPECIES: iron-sulfur cluster carrier protein ApbC [Halorhodospira]MBK5936020.1 Fe-S-binding ATPase [Halorhodospira halophila]MCC3749996.1 iron-sulfur cluster carrier protein ApbC [Halorhodospira halophila]MCG5532104.1 iron-sulfur cluster carrier protein ApbC [Halorhodospira sp. 9621]MCG5538776.1 iron-sulfur cluster carrier protein ApbC [Halorhodospira sp. 9622]MCG5541569.1 iron-sulfur cluster carrier protein ApbC [Halorhodospira sp. M39old]
MTNLTREAVEQALRQVRDHYLGTDPVSAGCVDEIAIDDESVRVVVQLGYPAGGYRQTLGEELRAAIEQGTGAQQVQISVQTRIHAHAVQPGVKAQDEIKNIIAVASGKGGVGKSTVTANLALALQADGARVGVLDADIYGPSQPRMLGVRGQPESRDGKHMQPMLGHGIQVMSAGFLVDEETPMIWRGPMVTQALEQLLTETAWEGLDYLIVDMPPGTGDIQLTLAQKVPVSGGVIVTTPQDIALLDARKGLRMFEKVDVAVLGIVENMSTHICSNCGHEEHIFGSGGGAAMASQYGVHLLGSLPLDITIREQSDSGHPTVAADPDGRIATDYRHMARSVAAQLSLRERSSGSAFPNIVVGDSSE